MTKKKDLTKELVPTVVDTPEFTDSLPVIIPSMDGPDIRIVVDWEAEGYQVIRDADTLDIVDPDLLYGMAISRVERDEYSGQVIFYLVDTIG
jgi:hypothetical protein